MKKNILERTINRPISKLKNNIYNYLTQSGDVIIAETWGLLVVTTKLVFVF
jgi:hypothetical protein